MDFNGYPGYIPMSPIFVKDSDEEDGSAMVKDMKSKAPWQTQKIGLVWKLCHIMVVGTSEHLCLAITYCF